MPFIVPEYCEFDFDYRLVPNVDANEVKKKFESIIAQFNKENDANAELEFVYSVPSIEFDKMTDFIKLLKRKTEYFGAGNRIGLHYATDGGVLVPQHKTPFVIFGPGRMDGLHVANEWIEKDEVVLYSNILLDSIIESFSQ
jgi:acetylornithine deacetylase/succinyl-diaminopimelate desuccinylase-like protein